MKTTALLILVVAVTGGCAYRPVVDPSGPNMANYTKDLSECQALAEANDSTGASAAGGAAIGAGLSAAFSAILGGTRGVARWAAAGGVAGGARGVAAGQQEQRMVVRNCLLGRGHKVLN